MKAKQLSGSHGHIGSEMKMFVFAGVKRQLLKTVTFLGHVCKEDNLKGASLTGRVNGKRDHGRQRFRYLQILKSASWWKAAKILRLPQDTRKTGRLEVNACQYLYQTRHMKKGKKIFSIQILDSSNTLK